MTLVNMLEAKTDLTKLIRQLETKQEEEIWICRRGVPVAKLVKFEKNAGKRIGNAKGKHKPLDLDAFNSVDKEIWGDLWEE